MFLSSILTVMMISVPYTRMWYNTAVMYPILFRCVFVGKWYNLSVIRRRAALAPTRCNSASHTAGAKISICFR